MRSTGLAARPRPAPARAPAVPERSAPGWRDELRDYAGQVGAILWKDLRLEWRRREYLATVGLFTLLVLVIFTFALDLPAERGAAVAPGALWVAYLFGGTLGLGRGFAQEREWGTLEGLLLAPVDRGAIYLAKLRGNAIFMLAVELISLPVFVAFFDLPVLRLELLPVLLLGTLGFAAAGTLFAAMAAQGRSRDVLLPVLLFPVAVPVVISCVRATASVIVGEGVGQWLSLLIAFAAVIAVVAYLTFDVVVEDS